MSENTVVYTTFLLQDALEPPLDTPAPRYLPGTSQMPPRWSNIGYGPRSYTGYGPRTNIGYGPRSKIAICPGSPTEMLKTLLSYNESDTGRKTNIYQAAAQKSGWVLNFIDKVECEI